MSVLPTGIWDEPISADLSASPIKTDSGANHNELMLGLEEMGQVLSSSHPESPPSAPFRREQSAQSGSAGRRVAFAHEPVSSSLASRRLGR